MDLQRLLQKFLQRVDREARPLQLNVFQRAKLANTFKWRLLEKGVERSLVDELTQTLVLRLNTGGATAGSVPAASAPTARNRPASGTVETLLARGNEQLARGAAAEAAKSYQELLTLDPRQVAARNNLGAALCTLGRYREAEEQFRRAMEIKPSDPDAHSNLGTVLRWRGHVIESEAPLRRALKLKPTHVDAQINLGVTLMLLGGFTDAKALLEKALRLAPRNVNALVPLGQIAASEGRFAEAEELFGRGVEAGPRAPSPWAALAFLRKMTRADEAWVKKAEEIAAQGLPPAEEANIRYSIGKYYDDVADYKRAFRSYRRANELRKMFLDPYNREARTRFVDDMTRTYTAEAVARARDDASDSQLPVFVVGMPRSGTSLVEQIIASHPDARGAGELAFWSDAMRKHEGELRHAAVGEALRSKLATAYLRLLERHSRDALRVVDKATFNSEYLGVINSVFPRARIIYVDRDPIDTCLSCHFQQFPGEMNFILDLSDLAHYCREHRRLMSHWRGVLPAGALLEVPYAALVADQQGWTRRMLEFIGLPWDERCLEFQKTERTVLTASYWQVRQKIYSQSVGRWHHYEEFVGPLLGLKDA